MADILDYISLTTFTPGRAQYALGRLIESGPVDETLRALVDTAAEAARACEQIEARWAVKKAQPNARGDAAALDAQMDRAVGALHMQLNARRDLLGDRAEMGGRIGDFLLRQMPGGALGITLLSYEDELAAVTRLVKALRGDEELVAFTEVSGVIEVIERLLPLLRVELDRSAVESVTFDEVRAGRVRMQRGLVRVVAGIVAGYGGVGDGDFGRLMGPIEFQAGRIRGLRKGRRRVGDVDAGTGGEVTL